MMELNYNELKDIIPYIVSDERKYEYTKYTLYEEFFKLPYEEMKRAIKIGAKDALISFLKKEGKGVFNDYDYTYTYEILNDNGYFGIIDLKLLGKGDYIYYERDRRSKN